VTLLLLLLLLVFGTQKLALFNNKSESINDRHKQITTVTLTFDLSPQAQQRGRLILL